MAGTTVNSLSSLLDLSAEIERRLIESDGEITEEIEQLTSDLDVTLPAKIDAYAYVVEQMETQQDWYEKQIKELQRNKKARSTAAERVLDRLKQIMISNNLTELSGERKRFTLQSSNPKLVISDDKLIPASYLIEETRIYPDNDRIKTDLKSGITIPGCELKPSWALMKKAKK